MKKVLLLLILTLALASCSGEDESIGIIGGADGPTTIITGTKIEKTVLEEMPEIKGLPALPGEYAEASLMEGMYVLKTTGVTDVMLSAYTAELESEGFTIVDGGSDGNVSMKHLSSDDLTVVLTLTGDELSATVWVK